MNGFCNEHMNPHRNTAIPEVVSGETTGVSSISIVRNENSKMNHTYTNHILILFHY